MWIVTVETVKGYNVMRFNFETLDGVACFMDMVQEHITDKVEFKIEHEDEFKECEEEIKDEIVRD